MDERVERWAVIATLPAALVLLVDSVLTREWARATVVVLLVAVLAAVRLRATRRTAD